MPTGYTCYVADGKITRFEDFALLCSRAFGALIEMRDDPLSTPVPQELPDAGGRQYDREGIVADQARLARLQALTPDEVASCADAALVAAQEAEATRDRERDDENNRYSAMLAEVSKWEPPTPGHTGLKEFMLQQLRDSIMPKYGDPVDPANYEPRIWLAREIASAARDVEYHAKNIREDIERRNTRQKWIDDLRASLAAPPIPTTSGAK